MTILDIALSIFTVVMLGGFGLVIFSVGDASYKIGETRKKERQAKGIPEFEDTFWGKVLMWTVGIGVVLFALNKYLFNDWDTTLFLSGALALAVAVVTLLGFGINEILKGIAETFTCDCEHYE